MNNDSLDESAYTRAIQPLDFASATSQPGSHEWARCLVEGYVSNLPKDDYLANMLRQVREYLFENKPVQAMDWLRTIETYLKDKGTL